MYFFTGGDSVCGFSWAGHGLLRLNVRMRPSGTQGKKSGWHHKKSTLSALLSGLICQMSGSQTQKSGVFKQQNLLFTDIALDYFPGTVTKRMLKISVVKRYWIWYRRDIAEVMLALCKCPNISTVYMGKKRCHFSTVWQGVSTEKSRFYRV